MAEKHPDTEWLFGGEDNRSTWEAERRFISPLFNSIYRQGVIGNSHLPEASFAEFLADARVDVQSAVRRLNGWVETSRDQGGDFGDLAIDRLVARAGELDAETALGVVAVFAEYMDTYYRIRPKADLLVDTWQKTETILQTFARSVEDFNFQSISAKVAEDSAALSWMISSVGRTDLWSHGLAGNRQRGLTERLLSEPELKQFLTILFARLSTLERKAVLKLPNLLLVLLTFLESPWHKAEVKKIIRRFTGPRSSDEHFIHFIEATSGKIVSSNHGSVNRISPKTLDALVGPGVFQKRWSLLNSKTLPPALGARVAQIEQMIDESESW